MVREWVASICGLGALLATGTACLADPHEVTFDKDGTAFIKCACILATSACTSRLGDAMAGAQRNTWTTIGHANAGHKVDLSNYCWTKRNATGEGDGLCCRAKDDSSDVRFFWGDLDQIKP